MKFTISVFHATENKCLRCDKIDKNKPFHEIKDQIT